MDNKEIQRQRMMKYFIDAAKEIIKKEGVKGLTVRKVGDKAGYSYATIYNYFNDLNTLLIYCVLDFLEDCYRYILNYKNEDEDCEQQIITYASAYLRYFAENPDMFQLIFLEDLGQIPKELMKDANQPSVGKLLREKLAECADEGFIARDDIELLQNLIGSSIHGKLIFFIKKRSTEGIEDMVLAVQKEIEFVMEASKKRVTQF